MNKRNACRALVAVVALTTLVTGCSDSKSSTSDTSSATAADSFKGKTIIAGGPIDNAPFVFGDSAEKAQGFLVDLSKEIGTKLGATIEVHAVPTPDIAPGLASGKIDMALINWGITPERLKVGQFVPFLKEPTSMYVATGNPKGINAPEDICGKVVGVIQGSQMATAVASYQKVCKASPAGEMTIRTYQNFPTARLAVISGQVAVSFAPETVFRYLLKTTDLGKQVSLYPGPSLRTNVSGLMFTRTDKGDALSKAVSKAMDELIADGTYKKLLAKYNLDGLEVTSAAPITCTDCAKEYSSSVPGFE